MFVVLLNIESDSDKAELMAQGDALGARRLG
jgi:hypothetical protein